MLDLTGKDLNELVASRTLLLCRDWIIESIVGIKYRGPDWFFGSCMLYVDVVLGRCTDPIDITIDYSVQTTPRNPKSTVEQAVWTTINSLKVSISCGISGSSMPVSASAGQFVGCINSAISIVAPDPATVKWSEFLPRGWWRVEVEGDQTSSFLQVGSMALVTLEWCSGAHSRVVFSGCNVCRAYNG